MVVDSRRVPFVGREHEIGILMRHLAAAREGQGRLVLLGGEPGIGKTRLAQELAIRAGVTGWRVLTGHAYETEGMPPYLPFTEAMQSHIRSCSAEDLQFQLGRGAPDVARLIPGIRDLLPNLPASLSLSPEHERYRLFESVCDFLLAVAQLGDGLGLVLVLDGLQWADTATLLLLTHLARRLEQAPVLVLGTYRSLGLDPAHPLSGLMAAVSREALGEQVILGSLTAGAAADLIAAIAGTAAAPEVVQAIYQRSAGTPFFLSELVRHLQAEGLDLSSPRAAFVDLGVPVGVRQVVRDRLARLSADANRLLQMAAISGDGFTFDLLLAMSGSEPEPLLDALDEAVGAGMLREEAGIYRFSHDLIRQTVLDGLSGARRQRLHLRAAQGLERLSERNAAPPVAALAHHYRQAGSAASNEQALTYTRQAAGAAAAAFAWEEMATQLEAAIGLLTIDHHADHAALLLALGEARQRAGELSAAREAFQQAAHSARTVPAPEIFARAALGIALDWDVGNSGGGERVNPWLEEALSLMGEADSALRTRLLARLASGLFFLGEPDRAEVIGREALAAARRIGDPTALGKTLVSQHYVLWTPEHLQQRLAFAEEIVQLGVHSGDRELTFEGRFRRVTDLVEMGHRDAFDVDLPILVRLSEDLRQPWYQWLVLVVQGMQALLEGRLEDASKLAEQALAVGRPARGVAGTLRYLGQTTVLRWLRGRGDDLESIPSVTKSLLESTGQTAQSWQYSLCLVGCAHMELGREEEARRIYDQAFAERFRTPWNLAISNWQPQVLWMAEVAHFCQLCVALNDVDRAASLYARLNRYGRHCFVAVHLTVCIGAFGHYLGLLATALGMFGEAEQHFAEAIAINGRLGARPLVANSQREYAAMLLRRRGPGDREQAHELLHQALSTYTELGMEHWSAKARALIGDLSLRPGRATPAYPDGLTAREVEVLRLVAAGKSNQSIADVLVISLSTVLHHMSHIFAKTGAANRAEATSYAHRHGLTS